MSFIFIVFFLWAGNFYNVDHGSKLRKYIHIYLIYIVNTNQTPLLLVYVEELIASDLVKPNWNWRHRFRGKRLMNHCSNVALLVFVMNLGIYTSFMKKKNNPSLFPVKYGDGVCMPEEGPDQILLHLQKKG